MKAVAAQTPLLTGNVLRKWFFQITANSAINWLRSEKRRRTRERSVAMARELSACPERSGPEAEELKRDVENELAQLDEKVRAAISLHYEGGFSYDEVSEILGVPAGTLRAYSSQGLKQLRERLGRESRPVSAEVLVALLAAGATFTASPAFAATVQTIIATQAAAATAATTATGAKVFFTAAKPGLSFASKMLIASITMFVAVLGVLGWTIVDQLRAGPATSGALTVPLATLPQKPNLEEVKEFGNDQKPPVQVIEDKTVLNLPPPTEKKEFFDAAPELAAKRGDYFPPPEVEAEWANSVNLLKGINPARDGVAGGWHLALEKAAVAPGQFAIVEALVMDPGNFTRIAIPCRAPEEYDFRIDFTRRVGWLDVDMLFSHNGKCAQWLMGAMDGQHYCFSHHQNNIHVFKAPRLINRIRHTCIVKVRKNSLSAFVDGEQMNAIDTRRASFEATSDLRLPDQSMLGLGGWESGVVFHRVALREVTGKAVWIDPATLAPNATPEYWQNAKDLMPAAFNENDVVDGQWRLENGELKVGLEAKCSRYQLDYQPPEEYDMLMDFTRTDGKRGVIQVLAAEGHQFLWRMDVDGMSGLDQIAGAYFYDSPTTMHTPALLPNNVRHQSIVCVRKSGIRAYVDGKLYLNWPPDYAAMDIEGVWKLKTASTLGIGATKAAVTYHRILVKEVTGQGRVLPPPSAAPDAAATPPRERDF